MRVNCGSALNEINESDVQHEKRDEQRIWTWRGFAIDLSEEHDEMYLIRRISIRNQCRTKLITVIYNMQNMVDTEFESDGKRWYVVRHQNIDSMSPSMNPK
jgi:hypothetical protein